MIKQEEIFIKVDDFDDISKILDEVKKKTETIRKKLDELRVIKEKEDDNLRDWEDRVEKLMDKIGEVETSLAK